MEWLFFLGVVLVAAMFAVAVFEPSSGRRREVDRQELDPVADTSETIDELVIRDPIEAIRLYGTPETADYLRETGRGEGLHNLGYRD